tara:strand:+ start:248 stop:658 length:411 start_codon:yes stop_codon:yes gene_type:complete
VRNKRSKKSLYLKGFLASILITSPSIANPSKIGPRENITKGTNTASLPVSKIYINEGSLANNYPMKISDMIDKKSWMKQCLNELVEVDRAGFSGRNICNCLWDKLETPWFDASSVYETKNAATICSLQEMKRTMPY